MLNKKSYTAVDFYKGYKLEYPESDIEYKLFKVILETFNKSLRDLLLIDSEELMLPYNLGEVKIVKYKPKTLTSKSLSPDYGLSKKLGFHTYHLNEHSGGYKFRLFWSKLKCVTRKPYKYSLNLVRANKRMLASLIIKDKKDYIEL